MSCWRWAERSEGGEGYVALDEVDKGIVKQGYDLETAELAKAVTELAEQLGWQVSRPFDPELRVQPYA